MILIIVVGVMQILTFILPVYPIQGFKCTVLFLFFKISYPLMKTVKISDEVVLLFSILTFQDSFSQ